MLLAADGVDLEQKDRRGQTPCARTATNGHTAVVQILQSAIRTDNAFTRHGYTQPEHRLDALNSAQFQPLPGNLASEAFPLPNPAATIIEDPSLAYWLPE
ncbi:hypothetical protein TSTA_071470 [Talaromyces stipitatus ATCC 10500]|uniref:Uncharacterized protein n=1 Tax=Talaromyces stipitatus (strain ATCC 10500 / CBS 375.48 / QM 6759 / NRRL 1006) TaxID=441959 RepID=B8LUH7_TALSN|nr:uncharacterized protein TSTA_071470 [Talaromyces stipitatus ATCC 10500]EED23750.1 hypothetical protein TSTA_071470 [Talaromyces stipitatus ATCC 10500]